MSASKSKEPLLDRAETVSLSLAQDALRGNLDATDSTLTLCEKKSWFGSLRDAAVKGALQAKAAVDSLRGDQQKSESYVMSLAAKLECMLTDNPGNRSTMAMMSASPSLVNPWIAQYLQRRLSDPNITVAVLHSRQRAPYHRYASTYHAIQ